MVEVSASCVLAAAQERLWELLSDVRGYPEWVVGTDEVLGVDGGAGGLAGRVMRPRIARDDRRTVANFAELVRREAG